MMIVLRFGEIATKTKPVSVTAPVPIRRKKLSHWSGLKMSAAGIIQLHGLRSSSFSMPSPSGQQVDVRVQVSRFA
jgi:hypothetical protein